MATILEIRTPTLVYGHYSGDRHEAEEDAKEHSNPAGVVRVVATLAVAEQPKPPSL